MFWIRGMHGDLWVDNTGRIDLQSSTYHGEFDTSLFDRIDAEVEDLSDGVVNDEDGENIYRLIEKFDVGEWNKTYAMTLGVDVEVIDILDIGYWGKDGEYEPPCLDWRQDKRREQEESSVKLADLARELKERLGVAGE